MIPTSFEESDSVLDKPEGYTDEQCSPLSIARISLSGIPCVVSCWKLTREELEEVNKTGRVWLLVHGTTMPPAALTGIKPL